MTVETYQSWTEKLSRLVRGAWRPRRLLALVVFASVLAVVGSTMRLVLQRRRMEVEVLKLVGATDAFVRKPFVIEGSVQGALGARRARFRRSWRCSSSASRRRACRRSSSALNRNVAGRRGRCYWAPRWMRRSRACASWSRGMRRTSLAARGLGDGTDRRRVGARRDATTSRPSNPALAARTHRKIADVRA